MKVYIEFLPEEDTYVLVGETEDASGVCHVPIDLYRPDDPLRHPAQRTFIGAELDALAAAEKRWMVDMNYPRLIDCAFCGGDGDDPADLDEPCPECDGEGMVWAEDAEDE